MCDQKNSPGIRTVGNTATSHYNISDMAHVDRLFGSHLKKAKHSHVRSFQGRTESEQFLHEFRFSKYPFRPLDFLS